MRVNQNNNSSKARLAQLLTRSIYRCILALSVLFWFNPLHADDSTSTPDALVPIDTVATNGGNQGISLTMNRFCGDSSASAPVCFYENPGSASDVQVLVLFEDSLKPFPDSGSSQVNQSFATDQAGLTNLSTFLTGLQSNPDAVDNVLVMLVYNSSAPPVAGSFSVAINGLDAIGQKVLPPPGHPWSIIGIPGMVPGKAAFNLAEPINGSAPGGLKGYIRESWLFQNGQSFQHRLFDFGYVENYNVTPVADAANYKNVQIRLAGNSFSPPALPSGFSAGGFYAVQFNTTTMDSNAQAFWIDDSTGCVDFAKLNSFLSDIPPPSLSGVALASLGKAWNDKSGCSASDWTGLLETIELLGLNPDIFARAVDTNLASPYSMISSNGRFGSGLAYQASGVLTDWIAIQTGNPDGAKALPQSAGVLQGALERNSVLGQIYPATGDPAGLYSTELQEFMFQPPIAWPMTPVAGATSTGQETAFAWVVSCSQDIMQTDWISGVPSSNAVVRQTAITLRQSYIDSDFDPKSISPLPSACGGTSISPTEISNATSQLTQEFDDRTSIQGFFTTVMAPLVDNQTTLYNDITDVAQSIANDELNADTTLTLSNSSNWGASIFKHTLEGLQVALKFFGDGGPELAVIGDFLSTASSGLKFILGATASSPTGQVNQTDQYLILQSQLAQDSTGVITQVTDSIAQWRNSMTTSETAILQDWGKMMAVSANLVAGGKWLFDPDDVTTMANAWDTLARQQTYYSYWPLKYNVGAARVSADGSAPGDSYPDTWFCSGSVQGNETDGTILSDENIQPFVDNGGIPKYENDDNKNSSTATPSLGAYCSDGACGIGDGQTYLPLFDIFSNNPEQLVVYMFSNSWNFSLISGWVTGAGASGTTGQGYANIVPADTMTNLTDQINANSANTAANFYPPTFWFKARSPNQLACGGSQGSKLISTGFYSNPGTPTVMQAIESPEPVMRTEQSPVPLRAKSRSHSFNSGDTLRVSITVQNVIQASDFYMAALMPDGNTMFFVTELNPLTLLKGALDNPASFRPLSNRDQIPTHEYGYFPNLLTYSFSGLEPSGTYIFYSAITRKDAFRDNRINNGDILSLDMDEMIFGEQAVE